MPDLSRVGDRERLKSKPGDEPHWQRLRPGCHLGYRPSVRGGIGTWFARALEADSGKYRRKALGDYGKLAGNERFAMARKEAEAWGEQVETGSVRDATIETVADAARAYLQGKDDANGIAGGIFRRHVFNDPIAKVKLDKLRRHHLASWRKRLEDTPALLSRNKGGVTRSKKRALSTVNRDMAPLRAALGALLPVGAPGTDAAWQEALKPVKGADGQRTLYLDLGQRRKLLANACSEVAPLLHALCLMPLRPGAHAARVAGDFEKRTRTLTVGREAKTGKARKITVPQGTADFLASQAKGKLPASPLFCQSNGKAWNKDAWKGLIKQAAAAAGLPSGTCAYTLRHSVITDLVIGGLPILTIAQISGTSVAMIEKHYGHLVGNGAEEALARLAL